MKLKKPLFIILAVFLFLNIAGFKQVYAEEHVLENLEIHVFLNQDGSAYIKERRVGYFTEGTENYLVIENLGKSIITDFKVTEDGQEFQLVEDWDIDASREEKMFKNGIIETNNGYELSWGIGEYGQHEYLLEYTITDFIKELEDAQILFWRFVNDQTNIPPKKVKLSIESDQEFNEDQQKIWGFGFKGQVGFTEDGMVLAQSTEALTRENYVTLLMQFEKGMFVTGDFINRSFEEVKEQAFEGSDYGSQDSSSKKGFFSIIGSLFSTLFLIIVGLSFLGIFKKGSSNRAGKFKRKYKEEYYREDPYEGNIVDIYYILFKMGLSDFSNILTGFILKWIYEDRIMTFSEETGFIRKKEQTQIRFLKTDLPQNALEGELFSMMLEAAGRNEILEENEFTKWARSHYSDIDRWEKEVKEDSIIKLENLGYLTIEETRKFLFKTKEYHLTEKGRTLEEHIYKYINYLYDYSLLNEHEAVNVKIWDRIMIWAGFLGIAEVVRKQFERLYPKYVEETIYRGNSIYLATALTRNVSNARTSARSSGFGGGTSIGGGGGSFGGGSGGGTR